MNYAITVVLETDQGDEEFLHGDGYSTYNVLSFLESYHDGPKPTYSSAYSRTLRKPEIYPGNDDLFTLYANRCVNSPNEVYIKIESYE